MRWRLIDVPTFTDPRGALSVVETTSTLPFAPLRAYWIHGVPVGVARGGHAHRQTHQLLIAITGSIMAKVDDGTHSESFILDHPRKALYLPPLIWSEEIAQAPGTTYLVLASLNYDPKDYLRDQTSWRDAL